MKEKPKILLESNAPEDWPRFQTEPLMKGSGPKAADFNMLTLIPEIQKVPEKSLKIVGLGATKLFEYGVLEIPFQIRDRKRDRIFDVYLYPDADDDAAGHFAGVKNLYQRVGWPEPVYLCPQHLPEAEPAEVLNPFSFGLFNVNNEKVPPGEYCIWWPEGKDRLFTNSTAFRSLDRLYQAVDGYETYIWAMILNHLEPEDDAESLRVALPDEYAVGLDAPENCVVALDVSREKGFRFFFHKETTSPQYRDNFLHLFSDEMSKCRAAYRDHQYPQDPQADEAYPLAWWNIAKQMIEKNESGGKPLQSFGSIEI